MNRRNTFMISTGTPSTRFSSTRNRSAVITGVSATANALVTTTDAAAPMKLRLDRAGRPRFLGMRARPPLWLKVHATRTLGDIAAAGGSSLAPTAIATAAHSHGEASPMPSAALPKPPSAISKVELSIDSLRAYDLIRPIPVVVEVLGERNYVAEMPDLNISTTASNPGDILITLKDRISQLYDGLRLTKYLDAEQSRQLKFLESYIAKTRRRWSDRR